MPGPANYAQLYNRLLYAGGYVLIALIFSACASTPMTRDILDHQPQKLEKNKELTDVPFFPQQAYQCGPAALATILSYSGIDVSTEALVPKVYLPDRKGSLQVELIATTRRYGRLPYLLQPSMETLIRQVKDGKPVLVLQNLGVKWIPRWHFAVVVGYDLDKGTLLLRSGKERRYQVDMHIFERTWQRSAHWAFIALMPGELPAVGQESQYFHTVADFERIGSTNHSIKAYQAGLNRWPTSKHLGMGLGNTYYQSGELEKAAESYSQVLSRNSEYAPAHNNLAQVMMEQGKLEMAKKHAQIAVTIGGNHQLKYQSTLDEILSRIATTNPEHGKKPLSSNIKDSRN
jgi:hypothetical protein